MPNALTLSGVDTVTQNLLALAQALAQAAGPLLLTEAVDILDASQGIVPVDTGALQASGAVDPVRVQAGPVVQTAVRYGGPGEGFERTPERYAFIVHENARGVQFKTGQDHYLSLPAFAATEGMADRLAAGLAQAMHGSI